MNYMRRQFLTAIGSTTALVLGRAELSRSSTLAAADDGDHNAAQQYLEAVLHEEGKSPCAGRKVIRFNSFDGRFSVNGGGRIVAMEKGRYYEMSRPTLTRFPQGYRGSNLVLRGFLDGKPWMRGLDDLDKCVIENFRPIPGRPTAQPACLLHIMSLAGPGIIVTGNKFVATPLRVPASVQIVPARRC